MARSAVQRSAAMKNLAKARLVARGHAMGSMRHTATATGTGVDHVAGAKVVTHHVAPLKLNSPKAGSAVHIRHKRPRVVRLRG